MTVIQESSGTSHSALAGSLKSQEAAYRAGSDQPLRSYTALMAAYMSLVGAAGFVVKRKGRLPDGISPGDLALGIVATHKLSRLVTKETVTSPLRAGFTRFVGPAAPAELHEEVRGTGAQKAVGELVTCPFCVGHWLATGFIFGFALAPRATRMVASVLAVTSGSDFLQFAYAAAQRSGE